MLTSIAIIAALLLVGASIVQGSIAVVFGRWFQRKQPVLAPESKQQHAAVIMSVRGCDPSLKDSLEGILRQRYKSYEVHLVVDHRTDQAWEFVHEIKARLDTQNVLRIHEMQNPRETFSLKCHAIVQALTHVSEHVTYIALLDADVTPHETWLAAIIGPLDDATIGGVTGNQWFEPRAMAGVGSVTRSTWNGGALVPTVFFSNPWAGSFAMRKSDLEKAGLAEIWSHSVVDDGPIKKAINDIGLRVEFAPSLIMVNRESCTFGYVNRWVTRMLTWSRLYEPTFFLSIIHAAFSNTVMLGNFAVLFAALSVGHAFAIGISASALIVSGIMSTVAYLAARKCVARSCELRGETLEPISIGRFAGVFSMVAVAHLIYGVSCARATMLTKIKWREITYEVKKHDDVRRLNYQPYVPSDIRSDVSI
jgi:glycosyltransferase involved in cell wall biosynthesis